MKTLFILIILTLSHCSLLAQNAPLGSNYSDTLWAETDTFYVNSDNWEKPWSFSTTKGDTIDLGTDGYEGVSIDVWTSTDTVKIRYVNSPFKQWLYIPIASPKDTTVYRLRFNPQRAVYSEEYVKNNKGKVSFDIPEAYELANVILFLSDYSQKTGNHPEDSEYAKKILEHFSTFKDHPLIEILNARCGAEDYFESYYNFRENSICYEFEGNNLIYSPPYAHVWGSYENLGGSFRELIYLVQDFAIKSEFRKFYQEHQSYYQNLKKRAQELMSVGKMWHWLENEFPIKIQSYKIIFSPLIEGSHSTQKFYQGSYIDSEFYEVLMFVNSTEHLDQSEEYSEKQKEGLMSGIVFTEIDHNYVNPTTDKYREEVKHILHDLGMWAAENALKNYGSEYAVFNEYMTHALFCLYIHDNYPKEIADLVIQKREDLMARRGFKRFTEFNQIMLNRLRKENRKKPVADYYPEILEQMERID